MSGISGNAVRRSRARRAAGLLLVCLAIALFAVVVDAEPVLTREELARSAEVADWPRQDATLVGRSRLLLLRSTDVVRLADGTERRVVSVEVQPRPVGATVEVRRADPNAPGVPRSGSTEVLRYTGDGDGSAYLGLFVLSMIMGSAAVGAFVAGVMLLRRRAT